ncbi:Ni/Fe-hydrogenase, b-type cytochrome subunit [Hydrogenibacillus schlegelii]|nr:Ni/Fe-hydrogenase, b-type cytochrome subunit [Hydrogenibacillus schlegelii]PTQ54060.1 MAG: [NiFe] uptake hydrogenas cytochrome b subunit [Hydrogenibacillus schlegelii]
MAEPTGAGVQALPGKTGRKRRRDPIYHAAEPETVKVYVWELPVRIWHWVNALSIFVLFVTGIYIGNPFVHAAGSGDADAFLMGWVRIVHFVTAFVFTLGWVFRLYWNFFGNRYAIENPFRRRFWSGMWETVKYYLFLPNRKPHYVGHNPLAMLSYWLFGVMSLIVILTGFFLLFEPHLDTAFGRLVSWMFLVFGDSFSIRSWHHVFAWLIILFVIVHVYMAVRDDLVERSGTISSMITGYKTAKRAHLIEADEDAAGERKTLDVG